MAKAPPNLPAEVAALRRKITDLKSQRAAIPHALVPKDVALARADEYIDQLARKGAIDIGGFTTPDGSPPQLLRDSATDGTTGCARVPLAPVAHLVAWLDPESLKKRLREQVEAAYRGGPETMSETDRAALERTLAAQQIEHERQEERLIREAEAAGVVIVRRPDADPRALLLEG